jgi:hypothetical protein
LIVVGQQFLSTSVREIAMLLPAPVFIESFPDAPLGEVSGEEAGVHYTAALEAAEDAGKAADEADALAQKAAQAQARIHSHNEHCMKQFFWSRPGNWKRYGANGFEYQGYCKRNSDNLLVAHGEGEMQLPSGLYRCAEFRDGKISGLVLERYPTGTVSAGKMLEADGTAYLLWEDPNRRFVSRGHWVGKNGMELKNGSITYGDGSIYRGVCRYSEGVSCVAPSGFGVWSSGDTLRVSGFFQNGFAEGVARIEESGAVFEGMFSMGRLLKRTAGKR